MPRPSLPRERYRELGARYRHHYFARQHELVLFDGTLAMLQRAEGARPPARRWRPASRAAASTTRSHASTLRGLFDATRTADETASKPDPRMLLELMDELRVAPERTLMIGDTTHDLQLAANAGTASVGVELRRARPRRRSRASARCHVAHSTAELHDWLLRHG